VQSGLSQNSVNTKKPLPNIVRLRADAKKPALGGLWLAVQVVVGIPV
jgi:hypothetical protein